MLGHRPSGNANAAGTVRRFAVVASRVTPTNRRLLEAARGLGVLREPG